jgi:hypothetical protein
MKLFYATLVEDARKWYNSLSHKSIKKWDDFYKSFMKIWETKGDPRMLLLQLNEAMKTINETVKEFDARFEKLLQKIPRSLIPKDNVHVPLYTNAFEGKFGCMLKDNSPKSLGGSQDQDAKIERNILSSKVKPFHAPRAKDLTQC